MQISSAEATFKSVIECVCVCVWFEHRQSPTKETNKGSLPVTGALFLR